MNNQFTQPKNGVSKETNKEAIARIYGVLKSEVEYLEIGESITGLSIVYEKDSQTTWMNDTATGTIISWSIVGPTLSVDTSVGSFMLHPATIDDSRVSGKRTGSLFIYRTQADRNADSVSVKDFGVKMDKLTDDTAALRVAFASGMHVHFPTPVNGEFCLINDTLLLADNTMITGAGRDIPVIKCAATMDSAKNAIVTSNFYNGVMTTNKNVHLRDFCIDGNGFARPNGQNGFGIIINAEHSSLIGVCSKNSPSWNFFITSGNPFVDVAHTGSNLAMSKHIYMSDIVSIDPVVGDGTIIQGTSDLVLEGYTSIFSSALTGKKRQDAGFQIIEGCRNIDVSDVHAEHTGHITTALSISMHINRSFISNIRVNGLTGVGVSTLCGIWNDTTNLAITDPTWMTGGYELKNLSLIAPTPDTASNAMQARVLDVQFTPNVRAENLYLKLTNGNNAVTSQTANLLNIATSQNITVNGITAVGIPDVTETLAVSRVRGWITVNDASCTNIAISDIYLDNIGYFNRVINASLGVINKVSGLTVKRATTDGETKEAMVITSTSVEIDRISLPASGISMGRFSDLNQAMSSDNLSVHSLKPKVVMGGLHVRSLTNAGTQVQPCLLLERGFLSASGNLGKGSIAFWNSNATLGSMGVASYNSDTNTYTGIHNTTYDPGSTTAKGFQPVATGDTSLGRASFAWLNGYFTNAPQTVSDARLKKPVRSVTETEVAAGLEIAASIGFWEWNDDRGDREHAGQTVQEIISIMESHGLVPFNYAFITYEKWDDRFETHYLYDEVTGEQIEGSEHEVQVQTAGDIYGLKGQELALYLIKCISAKLLSM